MYGGSSASKSYTATQALSVDQLERCYSSLIFRKEQTTINDTIYNDFKSVSEQLKIHPAMDFKNYRIDLINGERIRFKGLDKEGKVKGVSGYRKIFLDELDQFTIEDYKEFRRRLRGEDNMQLIGAWNPVSEEHWLKHWLDDIVWIEQAKFIRGNKYSKLHEQSSVMLSEDGTELLIKTTYNDNKWIVGGDGFGRIDKHVLNEFEKMKLYDENEYNIYALGNWGVIKTGSEWFSKYDSSKHVKKIPYVPELPLHISFDFNVVPYMTLLVFQILPNGEKYLVNQLKEYCLADPNNTTEDVCLEFIYDFASHKSGLYFYGDASGRSRTTVTKEHRHNYSVIESVLESMLNNHSERVPRSNPPVNRARDYIARIMAGLLPIEVVVNPECENTLKDFAEVKQDVNGGFLKKKVKDKKTGITYESHGHCGDAFKYFIVEAFRTIFDDYERY